MGKKITYVGYSTYEIKVMKMSHYGTGMIPDGIKNL